MLEETLKELTVALREHTAAIVANTAKMTELTGNVVPITKPAETPETPEPAAEKVREFREAFCAELVRLGITKAAQLNALTAANTAKMTELTGTPANVVPITKPAPAPKEKAKPAAKETPAPVVEETPEAPEPEIPAEETPEPAETPETPEPAAEETPSDDHLSWDDATLKLAIQEHAKTRLVAPNSGSFKEAFDAELARLGITKAAQLTAEQRPEFYGKMLTW